MTREYSPDKWVIVQITSKVGVHERVLASWYGGFATGDEWKLSSGIEGSKLEDEYYTMPQTSGSVYACHAKCYGMSNYARATLNRLQNAAEEANDGTTIRLMDEAEAKDYLKIREAPK